MRGTRQEILSATGQVECDLVLRGGLVFSSTTREFIRTDLAVLGSKIVGWADLPAKRVVDVTGKYLIPGFIDAHMHLESTKLWIDEFARTVVPLGTTAVAADPHEIANVLGINGVFELAKAATNLPLHFGICASSCVPASKFESSGAELGPAEISQILELELGLGVAEMMNYPGVISADPAVLARISTAGERRVDGHAPGVSGSPLDAYLVAGVESDHECTSYEEAHEKRQKGMWVFMREGSASRNLRDLIRTVLETGTDRAALCTDDREPDTLLGKGHVNHCVQLAVELGLRAEDAIVLATSNPAQYHGLDHLGSIAPGYQADILVLDNLVDFIPTMVFQKGDLVAQDGKIVPGVVPDIPVPESMLNTVHLTQSMDPARFDLAVVDGVDVRVIGVKEGSLSTTEERVTFNSKSTELSRLAVIERHHGTDRMSTGLVTGFGISKGAIASTVAHDAHNIMVVGGLAHQSSVDMSICVARLNQIGGGQVVCIDGIIVAEVPLPIAGLMSDKTTKEVAQMLERATDAASRLGSRLTSPFMNLSFLGLSVIPELRLTDKGLVDVTRFELTSLIYD